MKISLISYKSIINMEFLLIYFFSEKNSNGYIFSEILNKTELIKVLSD